MQALEKFIGFLARLFGPPRLFLAVAAWILLLGAWGSVARNLLPMRHDIRWDIPLELRAPLYAKFDSGWYLSIMEWGYGPAPPPGRPSNHAFFPLYPLTGKVLRDTFAMDGFHAGLLVSYLCFFLAVPLFFREAAERLGARGAWQAVAFLLLFPTAFYFAAVYAESMTLLFALLAFRAAREGRHARAMLWGALAALTRAFAMMMAPALFVAWLTRPRTPAEKPGRRWLEAVAIAAAPIAAAFLWIYGMGYAKGEPGLYFRSLEGWHRGSSALAGVRLFFASARDHVAAGDWKRDPALALDYFMAAAVSLVAIWQLLRRRWSDFVWTGCALALPISTGLSGGIPRFFAIVYSIPLALAEATRDRPRARWALWILSGALLLYASARFVNWQWVA